MVEEKKIRLTEYSHGGGCGCKIAPETLDRILKNNTQNDFHGLLVGNEGRDDAAVIDLGNGSALISTTDFFMPIVDDPFQFGMIAAANAISDIYAMGGKPVMAIAILGWPVEKLPASVAQEVVAGGRQKCMEANIPLAGGHSIESPEPFFGLAVNGIVERNHLKKNNTAQAGDLLFLTKPLGTGIITSASKKGKVKQEDMVLAIESMSTLNKIGEELGKLKGVTALTDITGFGLLGHLAEMAEGSNLSSELFFNSIPLICNLDFYLDQFIYPDMTTKIYASLSNKVNDLSAKQLFVTCDPQTSGGLLVAVAPDSVDAFKEVIKKFNLETLAGNPIGKMTDKMDKVIFVN